MVCAWAAMRWPVFGGEIPILSSVVLVVAGAFQFTSWKTAALRDCRSAHCRKEGGPTPLRYGLCQGASCTVCCSGPMLAMLIFGMTNLFTMALVTFIIAAEKLLPRPEITTRLAGGAAVAIGLIRISTSFR